MFALKKDQRSSLKILFGELRPRTYERSPTQTFIRSKSRNHPSL